MENSKLKAFLSYLETQNDWITASALANHFKVSTRTIRNYVSTINKDKPIISAAQNGYKLIPRESNEHAPSSQPQDSPSRRINMILKELIINTEGLDVFDLSEKNFVSTSTVENDIVIANGLIVPFHLKVKRKNDMIILVGEETEKRKLMSHILTQEASPQFLSTVKVQELFKNYNITQFKKNVINILEKYNLLINEYTINSIILHLVITMDRIKNNKSIEQTLEIKRLKSNLEMNAAKDIADMIQNEYGITFNEAERYYLLLLLSSKTTLLNYQSLTTDSLTSFVDKHYIELVRNLLDKVHESYFIDLTDDEFIVKFTLHIRNLVFRAKNKQWSRNPLTYNLKDTYPLIYEISVFISNELQKLENVVIKEDEIAYIAFHIGAFFERKKELETKILCAVVCPNYYNMQMNLVKKIEAKFRDAIEIIQVTSEIDNLLNTDKIEFIITTLPIKSLQIPTVFVHPYITKEDYEHIQNLLLKLSERKNILEVKNYLEMFFNEELFMKNIYLNNAEEYIKYMSQKLYEKQYVKKDYCESVLEREKMSSTAFNNNIAVPHSMKMDAKRTGICIIINDKPVKWGEEKVQIITMITINKTERQLFSHVFESFINILSEWENVKELTKAIDYTDFMGKISCLMDEI
ncbi:PTS sugar transporter subunit IIA [Paenibacillus sp. BSR1-1]|uniref:BglG family transcription antiterminator n=1 Tax=Paenibacillus sp. BSR1-1 TaxID=3020845 RepID=UPI0025B2093A|nr:PTS sugar transporter subunit IIA [Paenibacillus sp. BSR1-1]MDN3020072.1 PTS sugar transporter subunit IIA [Paenibacillus sp. BSR1-1]